MEGIRGGARGGGGEEEEEETKIFKRSWSYSKNESVPKHPAQAG